jgi:hypothetical protein
MIEYHLTAFALKGFSYCAYADLSVQRLYATYQGLSREDVDCDARFDRAENLMGKGR